MNKAPTLSSIRLAVVLLFLIGITAGTPDRKIKSTNTKPNIILIFTDDQRYNTTHALGNEQLVTPNLDRLVRQGTTFTHAYNMGAWHGAVCVASRAMLVTGMSVWNVKKEEKDYSRLTKAEAFWPQLMKKAGYETYMTGKWHVNTDVRQLFDHVKHERPGMPAQTEAGYNRPLSRQDTLWNPWDEEYGGFWAGGKHWSEVLADDAVEFLGEAGKKETPFFMYLAFNAPHDPRQAPKRWVDQYPIDEIKLPKSCLDEYPYKEAMGCDTALRDERLAPFPRTPYSVRKNIQEYYASISHMDEQVGRILEALEKSGKLENTYVLFTADHGLAVGHHGLMGKQSMFDHSMRTPLVISGPGIPKNEKRNQGVYLQDIMATSLEIAGMQKPAHVYFNSLLPFIKDKRAKSNYPSIYGCYMDLQRMVRTTRHKMIVYPKASKVLLFDMLRDPDEMNDLAGLASSRPVLKQLKERLKKQQVELNDELDLSALLDAI